MLQDLIRHVAKESGLTQKAAKAALGTILSAAERQGSPFASALFQRLPGARTLSAAAGAETEAPTGIVAQMIEQTPGGKRHVASSMLRTLHAQGLGHAEIGRLLPAIGAYSETHYGIDASSHLAEIVANDMAVAREQREDEAVRAA
ncbi:MAG: hypothetical protein AAGJ32_00460 [Pseudomonadota bacterium]